MTQSADFVNLAYLETMTDGDAAMQCTLLEMLIEELPTELEKMKNLTAASDWASLQDVSHKMKSTLAFVGNAQMTEANSDIELACKQLSGLAIIPARMEALMNLLDPVMDSLREEYLCRAPTP